MVRKKTDMLCSTFSPFYTTVINVVLWTLSLIPAVFTIWQIDDKKSASESPQHSDEIETEQGGYKEKKTTTANV